MLVAVGSFLFSMMAYNNAEDLSRAFIKGGEYVPNTTGINTITKKVFGIGADEFIKSKGIKKTFSGIAKKGIKSSIAYGLASGAFAWMFNPYVMPFRIALEGLHEAVRDENNLQKKNSLGMTADKTSLYMLDEKSNMLRNNVLQGSNIQEQQVTQLLNTPNMSANMMNEILGKL